MNIDEAIKDTNRKLIDFLRHDHWELKLGTDLIKQGLSKSFSGIFVLLRWILALLAIPFIPILYPIAIIIRLIGK